MHCLLAILLLAGDQARPNDRLAVMSLDRNNGYYEIYDPEGRRQFRKVDFGGEIMVAGSATNGPGTYMAIYCSPSLSLGSLGSYITQNTRHLEDRSKFGFHQDISKERNCLQLAKDKLKNLSSGEGIYIRRLLHIEDCSKSVIYSLAFQGNFNIKNLQDVALTPGRQFLGIIFIYNLFAMSDVVLDGKVLLPTESQGLQGVLAWYQGHLNVFQKSKQSTIWDPIKRSLHDDNDYHYIIDFLSNHIAEIDRIRSALESAGPATGSPSSGQQRLENKSNLEIEQEIKQQLGLLATKNLRFPESRANGLVGPFKDRTEDKQC
ncbi:BgTH12-01084 [Blumeria graminis f. sp. triticale]|uniref:BgtASP-20446 n=3 Tax=Blumeria graminis TaxID=34373 RepID=A0A9X9MP60_BLUGR|nr:hypothetical protein BGT96224_ASP20446 [Blumeria graminis f. sp. tritici 96224]CAD6505594.1 BgTH12-01084 [Blumeria graminis f. sp. triticale]VDB93730.1 BgtASP-20446 [Blumeria graminis f. sp. tritici]